MDAELRRMLERAVGEVDGAPESRFEARRRAQGDLPWHWNVGVASPPLPAAADCR